LENILYGKITAKNSEVIHAAELSNSSEFIERETLNALDDTPSSILNEMEAKKDELVEIIGQEKYDEEIEVIKKCVEQEHNKGIFEALDGDIDTRAK